MTADYVNRVLKTDVKFLQRAIFCEGKVQLADLLTMQGSALQLCKQSGLIKGNELHVVDQCFQVFLTNI